MTVSAQQRTSAIQTYERDGYAIFRDVVDSDLVAEASDHVAWLQRRHPSRVSTSRSAAARTGPDKRSRLPANPRPEEIAK